MILGRPSNLILGAFTALFNVIALVAGSSGHPIEPAIIAAVNLAAGAIIAVVAYQPPTLSPGDTINVQTAAGQPNYQTTIAQPPAQDPPPVPVAK